MRWLTSLLLVVFLIAACGENGPPPLGEGRELIVLTREGPTTYELDENGAPAGFEYDLVHLFADELGLTPRFVVVGRDKDILKALKKGKAHLAAAWLTPEMDPELIAGPSYFSSGNIIAQNETTLPVETPDDLDDKAVNVVAGSRQANALHELRKRFPGIRISEHKRVSELQLLERVAGQHGEAALVDRAVLDIASNFYPQLQYTLTIGTETPIVWLFPPTTSPELLEQAKQFIEKVRADGTLARLTDRYFGHVERLSPIDSFHFLERIRTQLPQYRAMFQAAQARTGIDWRLIAALAYQESQWNPLATSPTGVRGMMMLTEDTADRLRVSNRLDARQSILAGAQYLSDLRDLLPASAREPDRTWLALAAYNLGMGHLNAARYIAQTLNTDPDSWYEMKTVLPLLARPDYYRRLKSGKGRGGEAVIMTENIRMYYDILSRYEAPYRPFAERSSISDR
jgi:membrane-bound lytic murein transglycosylase F